MLFPSVDRTAPIVITAAPVAPIIRAAASASGVFEAARLGSVPSATIWASVRTAVTTTIVVIKANGTARRGSLASPAGKGATLDAPEAQKRKRGPPERISNGGARARGKAGKTT